MNLGKTPKSYRFKGGVIGGMLGIICVIFYIVLSIYISSFHIVPGSMGLKGIFFIPALPVVFFWAITYFPICGYEGPKTCLILSNIIAVVLTLIIFIILGVLIGWIIEKLKK